MASSRNQSTFTFENHTVSSTPKKGRRFFQQLEPTFSLAPATTTLQFVDNADPAKDLVVRKKAREWVHRNKEETIRKKQSHRMQYAGTQEKPTSVDDEKQDEAEPKQAARRTTDWVEKQIKLRHCTPIVDPSAGRVDPFDMLPDVGRKVDHIVEFFLHYCPDEIPCCDDKYAWRSGQSALIPVQDNTVLGSMAAAKVSYILWLHATTIIRDVTLGNPISNESMWFYKLALQTMREESKRSVEDYTDPFICSLACFIGAANFGGQYKAAEVHCNALIEALTLKGSGNIMRGLLSCKPFTQKAIAWCEFHHAAQGPTPPRLPYNPPPLYPLPKILLEEAELLALKSFAELPTLSDPIPHIVIQLHQLSLAQSPAVTSVTYDTWLSKRHEFTSGIIFPLYCAEFTLLQLLSSHKENAEDASDFERMFAEACQLYFWVALRRLGPQMKMCDLFVARLQKALLRLLEPQTSPVRSPSVASTSISGSTSSLHAPDPSVETTGKRWNHAIIWAVFIGTLVSSVGTRPEHSWFHHELARQITLGRIKDQEELRELLKMFPYTEEFIGVGLTKLPISF